MRGVWLTPTLALGVSACALDSDRPPLIDICADGACDRGNAGEGGEAGDLGVGGGRTTTGGSGGSAGETNEGVVLAGSIGSFETAAFALTGDYVGTGRLIAEGPAGSYVETDYDGTSYSFDAVRQGEGTWVQLIPDNPEYMAMIVSVDTTQRQPALRLPVLRISVLEEIYDYTSPVTPIETGRAHIILGFVPSQSGQAHGIAVNSPASSQVIYSTNLGWDSGVGETNGDGWAVLPNVLAQDFGDGDVAVDASEPVDERFLFPVAENTATFVRYQVGF